MAGSSLSGFKKYRRNEYSLQDRSEGGAASSFETLIPTYHSAAQCHNPGDYSMNNYCRALQFEPVINIWIMCGVTCSPFSCSAQYKIND
jgi:hypothetical protein